MVEGATPKWLNASIDGVVLGTGVVAATCSLSGHQSLQVRNLHNPSSPCAKVLQAKRGLTRLRCPFDSSPQNMLSFGCLVEGRDDLVQYLDGVCEVKKHACMHRENEAYKRHVACEGLAACEQPAAYERPAACERHVATCGWHASCERHAACQWHEASLLKVARCLEAGTPGRPAIGPTRTLLARDHDGKVFALVDWEVHGSPPSEWVETLAISNILSQCISFCIHNI
uniref:Uncharacterized protein n=1 Tax=Cannabis sativa TaxID=3483 RepID=A0A803QC58_CANSA